MAFIKLSMNISVKSDVKELSRKLDKIQKKQLPFASSKALNSLGFALKSNLTQVLPKYLHRPTKYMSRGIQVEKSTKKKLVTTVGFRSPTFGKGQGSIFQSEIMSRQIGGGTRTPKGRAIAVPVPKNKKPNKAGNIPRGMIGKLLGDKNKFFSGVPKGRNEGAGIWQRYGSKKKPKLKMVIGYEEKTQYKPRFPFKRLTQNFIKKSFKNHFEKALSDALKTA